MALKDNWKNKTDGVDNVLAEDINSIADAVIELEENQNVSNDRLFVANVNITTYKQITEALQAKKAVFLVYQLSVWSLIGKEDGAWCFGRITPDGTLQLIVCDADSNWNSLADEPLATKEYVKDYIDETILGGEW